MNRIYVMISAQTRVVLHIITYMMIPIRASFIAI